MPSLGEAAPHHLVRSVQNVRRELRRAVEGMSVPDLERRVAGMNSVAWVVGHLAWQEQSYWLTSRGAPPASTFVDGFGRSVPDPMPPFEALWEAWEQVASRSDPWLESLDAAALRGHIQGRRLFEAENLGSLCMRVIGHYYLHIGQITALRRWLGYPVPAFVGSQEGALYP
jgi:uncharacterized damage-inducible protein DinB